MSEIPEMVERVADKFANAFYGVTYLALAHQSRRVCVKAARAAIEAMREPTEEMWDAAADHKNDETPWEAMIDCALGENDDEKPSCN